MSKTLMYGLAFLLLFLVLFVPFFTNIVHVFIRILAPFIIAAFLSYMLYPIYIRLKQHDWPDSLAILFILSVTFVVLGLLLYKIYVLLMPQVNELKFYLIQYMNRSNLFMNYITQTIENYPPFMHQIYDQAVHFVQTETKKRTLRLFEHLQHIIQFTLFLTIVPLLVFFMMKDYAKTLDNIRIKYNKQITHRIEHFLRTLDERVGSYVKGQLILSAFITLISFIIYSILQIDYTLFFAILIGVLNVIPFFGPIIGAIPVIFIALQTSWKLAMIVTLAMLLIQVIENSFLSPYILGKTINIHPMLVFLLLIIGAEIAGIIGMIFIIPIYLTLQSLRSISF